MKSTTEMKLRKIAADMLDEAENLSPGKYKVHPADALVRWARALCRLPKLDDE